MNLSVSGAASQPVAAAAPDGTMHVLWWDSVAGEQYMRIGITQTLRSESVTLPEIYSDRIQTLDATTRQYVTALIPSREVRALTDAEGKLYVFWYDASARLLMEQIVGSRRITQTVSTGPVAAFDVSVDSGNVLHVAYVKSKGNTDSPAGVYYRIWTGTEWLSSSSVSTSSYFRTAKNDEISVSVDSDGASEVIVAWDDPYLGRSMYARSDDNGNTWTQPQAVGTSDSATQAHVTYTPNTEFMLMWRDPAAGACVLMQRRSNDGMRTWTAPQRILNSVTRCPQRWTFTSGSNKHMWLLGSAAAMAQGNQGVSDQAILAMWDNKSWSAQTVLSLSFYDTTANRTVSLGCVNAAITAQTVGMVGCDLKGDVWFVRSRVGPGELVPALTQAWGAVDVLSRAEPGSANTGALGAVEGIPALTSDSRGRMYALWSQPVFAGAPKISLFASIRDGQSWTQAIQVLDSPTASTTGSASGFTRRAEQPSLTADNSDRLHAVWVNGPGGILYYSRALVKDAISVQDWSQPVILPTPARIASWPQVLADPRNNTLYVIYAVPYNEQRGIYLIRSDDSGATWTPPVRVFDGAAAGWLSADKPQIVFDATANLIHAVWMRSELPGGSMQSAIFYARSADGGKSWTTPVQMATGTVDWPRITAPGANQALVLWNESKTDELAQSAAPMSVWGRSSTSGGEQWSDPSRVPGFEQVSGPVDVTSNMSGTAYFAGIGTTSQGESNLVYVQKTGNRWDAQDSFGLGQKATLNNAATVAIAPGTGQLGVLMREWVWQTDGSGQFGALAVVRQISATKSITPVSTFTPLPAPVVTATAELVPTPTPTQVIVVTGATQPGQGGANLGQSALVISGLLAAIIVVGVIVYRAAIQTRG